MVGQRIGIGFCAELFEQRRRAFDIREHEGDGAGRKLGPHPSIIRRCRSAGKQPSSGGILEHCAQASRRSPGRELEPPFWFRCRGHSGTLAQATA